MKMLYEDFVRRLLFLYFLEKHEEVVMADIKFKELTPDGIQPNSDFPRLELLSDVETNLTCVSIHDYKKIFEYLGYPLKEHPSVYWRNDSAYFLDILDMQVKYLNDSDREQNYANEEGYITKNIPLRSDDCKKNRFQGSIDDSKKAIQGVQFAELSELNTEEKRKKFLKTNGNTWCKTLEVDQALAKTCVIFNIYPQFTQPGFEALLKPWRGGQIKYTTEQKFQHPEKQEQILLDFLCKEFPAGYMVEGDCRYDSKQSQFTGTDLLGATFELQSKKYLRVQELKVISNEEFQFLVEVETIALPVIDTPKKKVKIKTVELDEEGCRLVVNDGDVVIKYNKKEVGDTKKFKILIALWKYRCEIKNEKVLLRGERMDNENLLNNSKCEGAKALTQQIKNLNASFKKEKLDIKISGKGSRQLVINKG